MAKKRIPSASPGSGNPREPISMGAIIHKLALENGFDYKKIAAILNCDEDSVYRIYKRKYFHATELLLLSEAFNVNLFLYYKPNVTPLLNPLQPVVDELQKQLEEEKKKNTETKAKDETILKQQGMIDELHRQLEYYQKR